MINSGVGFFSNWYYDGKPYDKDVAKRDKWSGYDIDIVNSTWKPVNIPFWLTRATLHRALFAKSGPYTDPGGLYTVPANQALITFEVKQGTPEWTPPVDKLRPVIQAILPINRKFVSEGSITYNYVDPNAVYVTGDWVAVWFPVTSGPEVVGKWRNDDPSAGRNNSGAIR